MAIYFAIFAVVFVLLVMPVGLLLGSMLNGLTGVFIARHEVTPPHKPSNIYLARPHIYKSWNSIHGWPRASNLFYECGICQKSLSSISDEPTTCGCGNLFVGPDHIGAQTPSTVRLYEEP